MPRVLTRVCSSHRDVIVERIFHLEERPRTAAASLLIAPTPSLAAAFCFYGCAVEGLLHTWN